jgi:hypothetical protein
MFKLIAKLFSRRKPCCEGRFLEIERRLKKLEENMAWVDRPTKRMIKR